MHYLEILVTLSIVLTVVDRPLRHGFAELMTSMITELHSFVDSRHQRLNTYSRIL